LDVGCGCGELTNDLSSSDAIDLDADTNMIAKAQQQFPHLQFIQTDVCEFDLEEPVDVIFSNAALQWVRNENNARGRTGGGLHGPCLETGWTVCGGVWSQGQCQNRRASKYCKHRTVRGTFQALQSIPLSWRNMELK
jgi:SAM-dependent methyltransferase